MRLLSAVLCLLALLPGPMRAGETEIGLRSVGYVTRCAEMDNVLYELNGAGIGAFTLRASHPAYFETLPEDNLAADFTDCVFPEEPIWHYPNPFETVLYEDDRILLRGFRLSHTWRPEDVPFHVGEKVVSGLHLTQLFVKAPEGPIEVLVLYPNDGYWRPKPLTPEGRPETGFGASVLIGPVETDRRPLVRFVEIRFDPATLTYALRFTQGGWGLVRVASADREVTTLEVTLDMPKGMQTFAMLSSMHVAPDNADIARVAVRRADGADWIAAGIDAFTEGRAAAVDFGRDVPSRHNASAPDLRFEGFKAAP